MPELILETEKMLLYQQQLGEWNNLNHLIICKSSNQACIIDPFDGKFWLDFCQLMEVEITEIWLTHTHWDHIKGVDALYHNSAFNQFSDAIFWNSSEDMNLPEQIGGHMTNCRL